MFLTQKEDVSKAKKSQTPKTLTAQGDRKREREKKSRKEEEEKKRTREEAITRSYVGFSFTACSKSASPCWSCCIMT